MFGKLIGVVIIGFLGWFAYKQIKLFVLWLKDRLKKRKADKEAKQKEQTPTNDNADK